MMRPKQCRSSIKSCIVFSLEAIRSPVGCYGEMSQKVTFLSEITTIKCKDVQQFWVMIQRVK